MASKPNTSLGESRSENTLLRLCSGNQLVAEGALAAGCKFFAGYPITPASEIYERMMVELPRRGGLALSAPDEISSLCYCVGASLAGYKAMTATSGPGWCLMIETLQYALMTETPVVVALVQRLGPSTGGATQGGQGDIWLSEFVVSGGYSLPVFCPSSAADCFRLTAHAFNWSERLRTPVVLLSDKEVGMTTEAVPVGELVVPPALDRTWWRPDGGDVAARYRPYGAPHPEEVPAFAAIPGPVKVTVTGSAHDPEGRLKKNAPEVIDVLERLQRKIEVHADAMALTRTDYDSRARVLLVSYGITARAGREAVLELRRSGTPVSFFEPLTLFPVPERELGWALAGIDTVVVAEENLTGQYRSILEPWLRGKQVTGVNKIGGMITPAEIVTAVQTTCWGGG